MTETPPHIFPGDLSDDDGAAIDDYFSDPPHGPLQYGGGLYDEEDSTPLTTKLIVLRFSVTSPDGVAFSEPFMALPADPNRREVYIESNKFEVTIAGNKGDTYGLAGFNDTKSWYSQFHTGAIWLLYKPAVATDTAIITVRSVTL